VRWEHHGGCLCSDVIPFEHSLCVQLYCANCSSRLDATVLKKRQDPAMVRDSDDEDAP
jgi:hypothetical protein